MISDQFRKDYAAMTAQGVTFTPEDIVRLNALSVRVQYAQRAADTVHLPRLAFIGRLVLREPTIAHELWVEEASRWIDCRDDRNFLWVNGYALSRPAGKLVDATRPAKLIRAVFKFAAKELCAFTTAQLTAAVTYALAGNDWWNGEGEKSKREVEGKKSKREVEGKKSKREVEVEEATDIPRSSTSTSRFDYSPSHFDFSASPTIGLLVNAKAMRLPITVDEAFRMTSSELSEIINRSVAFDNRFEADLERNRAFGAYVRAREEIRARAKGVGTQGQGESER